MHTKRGVLWTLFSNYIYNLKKTNIVYVYIYIYVYIASSNRTKLRQRLKQILCMFAVAHMRIWSEKGDLVCVYVCVCVCVCV